MELVMEKVVVVVEAAAVQVAVSSGRYN